jgi:hypothetical protein
MDYFSRRGAQLLIIGYDTPCVEVYPGARQIALSSVRVIVPRDAIGSSSQSIAENAYKLLFVSSIVDEDVEMAAKAMIGCLWFDSSIRENLIDQRVIFIESSGRVYLNVVSGRLSLAIRRTNEG